MQRKLMFYFNNLYQYGSIVMDQGDVFKGKVISNIALEATKRTTAFFAQDEASIRANFPAFKDDLLTLLNSQNKILATYRRNLGTIFKNIGICLTVIGAFVVAGKLLHSKIKTGRTLGFFASPTTTSELIRNYAIDTLNDQTNALVPPPPAPER